MLRAADFRARARLALKGNWFIAVLAALLVGLLTGSTFGETGVHVDYDVEQADVSLDVFGQTLLTTAEESPGLLAVVAGSVVLVILVMIVMIIVFGVIGSTVRVGYARFNLGMTDGQGPELGLLFFGFPKLMKTAFIAHLLATVYICLWTLLLIVPGIMASLSYAMVDYILCENPDMASGQALSASKQMMRGNRWRFFCLQLSFIGWDILAAITMGIGELWLRPYKQAAYAAFYQSLKA